MALIIETGAGVRNANAYHNSAFVSTYLSQRGRIEENGWQSLGAAEQDTHVLAGTDYIEQRWSRLFKGSREFVLADIRSTASIVFTAPPTGGDTLTLGDRVYFFVAVLTGEADEVLIGVDADESASNLFDALSATSGQGGVTYGEGTQINRHALPSIDAETITLCAAAEGSSGDFTTLEESSTGITIEVFSGGMDGGAQPLSFPRVGLYDSQGVLISGIPLKLKQASAEYTIRSASGTPLFIDPTVDALGGVVTSLSEKVGPIETSTEYLAGTTGSGSSIAYPAADRLLAEYVRSSSAVIRG